MRTLRAILRLISAFLWSGVMFPFALLSRLPQALGAGDVSLRLGAHVQRLWAAGMSLIIGVRLHLEGERPQGLFVVAANHMSYVDIFVLARLFPGRFVAKSEISGWPVIGWMTQSVGTLFVRQRSRRDLLRVEQEMRRTLHGGVHVVLFPEGGAHRGDRIERFHSSLFQPAVAADIPCLPVTLSYSTPGPHGTAWTVCWWGGMDLPRHVWRLLFLDRIDARVRWSSEPLRGLDRKELALRARQVAQELFQPVSQEPVPPDLPWPWLRKDPPSRPTEPSSGDVS